MKKLSSRIMLYIVFCSFITAMLIGGISIYQGSKLLKAEAEERAVSISEKYANEISCIFENMEGAVTSLSSQIAVTFDPGEFHRSKAYVEQYKQYLAPIIEQTTRDTKDVLGIYFTFNPELVNEADEIWYVKDGDHVKAIDARLDGRFLEEFQPPYDDDIMYYFNPILQGKGSWTVPYLDKDAATDVISYSLAVYADGILIGVAGADIATKDTIDVIEHMKVYDTGYAFLMDEDYNFLIHKDFNKYQNIKNVENGTIAHVTKNMETDEDGIAYYMKNHEKRIMGFSHMTNGWIIGLTSPEKEILAPVKSLFLVFLLLTLLGIALSITLAYFLSNRFSKPIYHAMNQLKQLESGNFTNRLPADLHNRNDELGYFIEAAESMQTLIHNLMHEINEISIGSDSQPRILTDISSKNKQATDQAAAAIERLAINTKNQEIHNQIIEEELRKTTAWLLKAQGIAHIGNWEWNLKSNKLWWSLEMYEITGFNPQESGTLAISPFLDRIDPGKRSSTAAVIHGETKIETYNLEFPFLRPEGKSIWLYHCGKIVYDESGNPEYSYGVTQDISDKKETLFQLEEMNRGLKELVEEESAANRKKDILLIDQSRLAKIGEMVGNIAHQWKQPLNNINLISANIKDAFQYGELNEESLSRYIGKLNQIVAAMSDTIEDFTGFLKPGKEKQRFSARDSIEFALTLMDESIRYNGIKILFDSSNDLFIYGYPNEFSHVLFNVLNNARDAILDHSQEDKTIRIRLSSGKEQRIEITNPGKPLEPALLDQLFTPYFTTKKSGTGIGLYLSKLIVDRMNGTMEIVNAKDGICCRICFPNPPPFPPLTKKKGCRNARRIHEKPPSPLRGRRSRNQSPIR